MEHAVEPVRQVRAPRAGELTAGWRAVTAVTWMGVLAAWGAVWRASDQLGLSTWWIGPRGDPNPLVVQLLPFVPGVLMVLTAINRIRHTAWLGLLASAVLAAMGGRDLGRTFRLGLTEMLIAAAAAAVSVASFAGTYRSRPTH